MFIILWIIQDIVCEGKLHCWRCLLRMLYSFVIIVSRKG